MVLAIILDTIVCLLLGIGLGAYINEQFRDAQCDECCYREEVENEKTERHNETVHNVL